MSNESPIFIRIGTDERFATLDQAEDFHRRLGEEIAKERNRGLPEGWTMGAANNEARSFGERFVFLFENDVFSVGNEHATLIIPAQVFAALMLRAGWKVESP